jgi:CRISPR type I-E-associated protein CasB/Cse2
MSDSDLDLMSSKKRLESIFWRWWSGLNDVAHDGANQNRGALARLRRIDLVDGVSGRAPDVVSALVVEPFRDLVRAVDPIFSLHQMQGDRIEDLVTVAVTLSRIRSKVGYATAKRLGGQKDVTENLMKEGRFLALLRTSTSADLFDQARRLADLLGGEAPVGELGMSLLLWRRSPTIRLDWARDYYKLDLNSSRERGIGTTAGDEPVSAGA